jgi:hypothetical protein
VIIETIGLITVLIGTLCVLISRTATIIAFATMTVLGGAAAVFVGSAGIQPGHLFLVFVTVSILSYRQDGTEAIRALTFPKPAFWLACLVVYGVMLGFFAPRILARMTQIIPVGTSEYPVTGSTVPLGPVSSNFTQALYLAADLLTFVLVVAVSQTVSGFRAVTFGLMSFATANLFFAFVDLFGHGTPLEAMMDLIRNAQYQFHDEDIVAGVKRVVGSWPEAAAFAGISLGIIGFTGTMWVCGRYSKANGILFLLTSIMVVRSTSSTGLLGLPVCLVIIYAASLIRCGGPTGTRTSAAVVLFTPLAIIVAALVIFMNEDLYRQIYNYFDLLIFSKSTTASGIERSAWNRYAFQNFIDSYGLGVGLGTSRTSSFLFALLSNVGIPGTVFFAIFLTSTVVLARGEQRTIDADIRLSARAACVCLLIGATVSGALVDLGLLFFILAGLAGIVPSPEGGREKTATRLFSPSPDDRPRSGALSR